MSEGNRERGMTTPQVVIDSNVMVAGFRSRRGASFRLLTLVGTGRFDIHLSVPLVLEYEDALLRIPLPVRPTPVAVTAVIDYHCAVAKKHAIFFLWRPFLPDPKDDMVLELAVTARCDYIITYNISDFTGITRFGLRAIDPCAFLLKIGALPWQT
jgi:predicted nucleic acid-binding protein